VPRNLFLYLVYDIQVGVGIQEEPDDINVITNRRKKQRTAAILMKKLR
jgi:hypothetical protein